MQRKVWLLRVLQSDAIRMVGCIMRWACFGCRGSGLSWRPGSSPVPHSAFGAQGFGHPLALLPWSRCFVPPASVLLRLKVQWLLSVLALVMLRWCELRLCIMPRVLWFECAFGRFGSLVVWGISCALAVKFSRFRVQCSGYGVGRALPLPTLDLVLFVGLSAGCVWAPVFKCR